MTTMISRDRCHEIVEANDAFFVTETSVNGYMVEMYNYRLASLSDFVDYNAFEMRGITFVYNPDTECWERHLAMEKFFNVNQTEGWMFDDLKDKKIVRIEDKADGSLIQFVRFPDGSVRAKSKMSFESEQAVMAQICYDESQSLRELISDERYHFIFELVSPFNQIVLSYAETELVLLKVRDRMGAYLWDLDYVCKRFPAVKRIENITVQYDLSDLLQMVAERTHIEGWVVVFEGGQKAKLKTAWYLALHGLVSDGTRENLLIEAILDDHIDDVISQLGPGETYDHIVKVTDSVRKYVNQAIKDVQQLFDVFDYEYEFNRRSFAIDNNQHDYFHIIMQWLKVKDNSSDDVPSVLLDLLSDHIKRKTTKLIDARQFIGDISAK